MSSAVVYGESAPIGKNRVITKDTPTSPENCYGDSKMQAENGIRLLNDHSFKAVILRPPMIYGKGSKGNYPLLAKLALKTPIFPDVKNQRSMLYVGNLSDFTRGVFANINIDKEILTQRKKKFGLYYKASKLFRLWV